ncbi:MAG: AAA family ATPase [Acidobacteria bacterium]|nr:AAA family ATPase [Acidobacteriota bacterium]
MIRRFTLEGFKRFQRETVIDLEDVTVLVGANNSGKSTILHALTLFQYCIETTRRTNGNGPEPSEIRKALEGGAQALRRGITELSAPLGGTTTRDHPVAPPARGPAQPTPRSTPQRFRPSSSVPP